MTRLIAALREGPHGADCLEIVSATAPEGFRQTEGLCRCLRRIETCRCGLAIFRAVSRRFLLGGQQRMLADVAWTLYRLSRRCHRRGCAMGPSRRSGAADGCDRRGEPLFEKLEGMIGENLAQMNQGCRIDREIADMGQLCRLLCRFVQAFEDQGKRI